MRCVNEERLSLDRLIYHEDASCALCELVHCLPLPKPVCAVNDASRTVAST